VSNQAQPSVEQLQHFISLKRQLSKDKKPFQTLFSSANEGNMLQMNSYISENEGLLLKKEDGNSKGKA
jgi:hypothetical protein